MMLSAVWVYCGYIMFCVVASFTEFLPLIFKIEGVHRFLSEKLSQDLLESLMGYQRQKGRCPMKANEFVIDFICVKDMIGQGNCRGTKRKDYDLENVYFEKPLKKRKRRNSQ